MNDEPILCVNCDEEIARTGYEESWFGEYYHVRTNQYACQGMVATPSRRPEA